MSDKVYCYPDSEVLVNKLNIRNIDRLHEAERRLTMLRQDDLLNNPIKGNFDLKTFAKYPQIPFSRCL